MAQNSVMWFMGSPLGIYQYLVWRIKTRPLYCSAFTRFFVIVAPINGLAQDRCHAISWSNNDFSQVTTFSLIFLKIHTYSIFIILGFLLHKSTKFVLHQICEIQSSSHTLIPRITAHTVIRAHLCIFVKIWITAHMANNSTWFNTRHCAWCCYYSNSIEY